MAQVCILMEGMICFCICNMLVDKIISCLPPVLYVMCCHDEIMFIESIPVVCECEGQVGCLGLHANRSLVVGSRW